jgi:DNA polymerase-1
LEESNLRKLFDEVEVPLIDVLAEMESTGIRVDTDVLAKMSQEFGEKIEQLETDIHDLAGRQFNIASPKQLAAILFDELQLPVIKRTKTGPSTDAGVLEELAREHPLPAKIISYRQYAKLKGTYLDALPTMVRVETDRIHASFNQVVAATGRLSSSDPNLQNIPVRTEAGRQIRSAFIPGEPGWKLLAADYSQIELRILAHFSADTTLCQAFDKDEDIHARVASEVYHVAIEDVSSDMRRSAKAVNFGVIYGQSPFGLARSLSIDQDEAAEFIDAYFSRYPGIEDFLKKTLAACRKNGYVKTILGRRRAIRGVRADAGRIRNLPERTAINTVVQGSAADLIKLAMLSVHRRVRREKLAARMLLQIHDELVFEVPPTELEYLGELVTQEMVGVLELSVPLKVDLKSGDNWADCEPWKL